eukprot:TRINITY_DN7626_c0_g1_i1.p1 TRINITY_DN7626_c0_g1~~TRINITY_DN7626_c0_g1_i1.p1  ORF type:complete len:639 (+),score=158.78 TRINITY_DN7626_c0_g1_i1:2057-3973(+)
MLCCKACEPPPVGVFNETLAFKATGEVAVVVVDAVFAFLPFFFLFFFCSFSSAITALTIKFHFVEAARGVADDDDVESLKLDLFAVRKALASLQKRESSTAAKEKYLDDQANKIKSQENEVKKKDLELAKREAILAKQIAVFKSEQKAFEDDQADLEKRKASVHQKEGAIQYREDQLARREKDLQSRESALQQKENALKHKESGITERERGIENEIAEALKPTPPSEAATKWNFIVNAVIADEKEQKKKRKKKGKKANTASTTTTATSPVALNAKVSLKTPTGGGSQALQQSMGMSFIFEDPISFELMEEAVMTPCGHSFSKGTLEDWLAKHASCPLCNAQLNPTAVLPNYKLRDAIVKYKRFINGEDVSQDSPTSTPEPKKIKKEKKEIPKQTLQRPGTPTLGRPITTPVTKTVMVTNEIGVWEWKNDSGAWIAYDTPTTTDLETQWGANPSATVQLVHGFFQRGGYVADLARMKQKNVNSGFEREIRRTKITQNVPTTVTVAPTPVPATTTTSTPTAVLSGGGGAPSKYARKGGNGPVTVELDAVGVWRGKIVQQGKEEELMVLLHFNNDNTISGNGKRGTARLPVKGTFNRTQESYALDLKGVAMQGSRDPTGRIYGTVANGGFFFLTPKSKRRK